MSTSDFSKVMDRYHQALDEFVAGDPNPVQKLFSRREDVTLANPLGPPVRGWNGVEEATARAASQLREGEPCRYERIAEYVTEELAYNVEIERTRVKVGGADELAPLSLRVTTIFRREDDEWRIIHRHADPITSPQTAASMLE